MFRLALRAGLGVVQDRFRVVRAGLGRRVCLGFV